MLLLENWINKTVSDYLENNIENIFNSISDKTISKLFDKSRDFIIETRHLKEEVRSLREENEELKKKLKVEK
jgi:cell shape-determining protein MreC